MYLKHIQNEKNVYNTNQIFLPCLHLVNVFIYLFTFTMTLTRPMLINLKYLMQ